MSKIFISKKGFTLTELMVVIGIIAILSSVGIVGFAHFIKKSAITNDELLLKEINLTLEDYVKNNGKISDNDIAIIVQNELNDDINIESQQYDMDIYYNTGSNYFEVLSKDDAEKYKFNKLSYYLNLIRFYIDREYVYTLRGKEINVSNGKDILNAYLNNNDLLVTVSIINDGDYKSTRIDLSQILYAKLPNGEICSLDFECHSVDLLNDTDNIDITTTDYLELYAPGKYEIIAYSKDSIHQKFKMHLYVKNIYWAEDPSIMISNASYSSSYTLNNDNTYQINFKFPNLLKKINLKDYDTYNSFSGNYMSLYEFQDYSYEYINSIDIFIEIDGKTYELQLNSKDKKNNQLTYELTLESIDLNNDNTINVIYRYQARNGAYYYCYDQYTLNIE